MTSRAGFQPIQATRFVRVTIRTWLLGFGLLPAFLLAARVDAVERVVRQDTRGDVVARRTDAGADGPIDPGLHALPDLLSYSLGNWQPANPQTDLFVGTWSAMGGFLRFEMVFDGVVNPPGPVGCCGEPSYDPYRYGPNPVSGYIELDVDDDVDTGGELEVPQLRYLGNTSRFGGLPQQAAIRTRAAPDYFAFDGDLGSSPLVERSGEDFHIALVGWEIQSAGIVRSDVSDWTFGAGETWIVPGYLFQRAHGYRQYSSACCRAGAPMGSYEPLVKLEFSHSTISNRTTITLVYPLTNAACAAMQGDPQTEPMDIYFTNQNSMQEALFELMISAMAASPADRSEPEFALIAGWESKNPNDYLEPALWQVSILVGGNYTESQENSLFAWSDICPDVTVGDVDESDFTQLQTCLSGSFMPPDPACVGSAADNFTMHGLSLDVLPDGKALLFARARHYDQEHGRWLQRDPLGFADGPNLYEAFGGNPVVNVDPSGLLRPDWHLRVTAQALDEIGFAPSDQCELRSAILVGSIYPDMPFERTKGLVGQTMTREEIIDTADWYNRNWYVKTRRAVGETVKDWLVPDLLLDNRFTNDVRDWWDSSSIVDPAFAAAAWFRPEAKDLMLYRSHKGDLQFWHGMTNGETAAEINEKLLVRLSQPAATYSLDPGTAQTGFLIGCALHTLQDLYTSSHVIRQDTGLIERFQDYGAQSPAYHGTADVFDLDKPADQERYRMLVDKTKLYLSAMITYNQGTMSIDPFLQQEFLATIPGGLAMGGTAPQFAPRPSVTGRTIQAVPGTARKAYGWGRQQAIRGWQFGVRSWNSAVGAWNSAVAAWNSFLEDEP